MTRPGFRAAELVGFIRWARRGVVVQGDQLVVDCWPLDAESILERAEAAGWIARGKQLPARTHAGVREGHAWEVSLSCPIYSEQADQLLEGWGRALEPIVSLLAWVARGCVTPARIPTPEEDAAARQLAAIEVGEEVLRGIRGSLGLEPRKPARRWAP